MSEFSAAHWLIVVGMVAAVWLGLRAPRIKRGAGRPIATASGSVMRPLGTLVFVLGICALLWACMAGLAIDPSNKMIDNLQWASTRNTSMIWGFGLVLAGLLMRATAGPRPPKDAPTDRTHRRCPACAEPVLREATKCKHCGEALTPLPYS